MDAGDIDTGDTCTTRITLHSPSTACVVQPASPATVAHDDKFQVPIDFDGVP
jgi:hypothetical protein